MNGTDKIHPSLHEATGQSSGDKSSGARDRSLERKTEDFKYTPVIIKRNDEVARHPDDTLQKAIEEGVEQYDRTKTSLFLSSLGAGLILGFAGLCVALASQLVPEDSSEMFRRFILAIFYPLGFVICIMSGNQLFTEHTATAVYPLLDKRKDLRSVFVLLSIVLLGNFLGTFFSSYLINFAGNVVTARQGYIEVFNHLTHYSFSEVFISSILAGWLMAQGAWLILSTSSSTARIMLIYIVTFIIGFGGFHHSIAGSAEIFSGLFNLSLLNLSEGHPILKSFGVLAISVLGNLLGGSFLVGLLNYAHIRKTT